MATQTYRFYLSRSSAAVDPGTALGTWGNTSKRIAYSMGTSHGSTGFLTNTYTGYGSGTMLHRQYISAGLPANLQFDASTTYQLVQRLKESSSLANAYGRFHVAIVSNSGSTLRAELSSGSKDGTEMATSLTGRSNFATGGMTYTTVSGDRLVLETGWDQDASGSYSISLSTGNSSSTDLSGDGDTDIQNPWFEVVVDIYEPPPEDPPPEDPPEDPPPEEPPATDTSFNVSAYISGVLDEWW